MLTRIIATCKRLRVDPFAYLRNVFERIAAHPQHRLEELLLDRRAAAKALVTP